MRMQCSKKGIDLIKSFEGFSLTAYHGKEYGIEKSKAD